MMDKTVVVEVAVKLKLSWFHTAGLGVPDPDVKVPVVPAALTMTLAGPPKKPEFPP
jgi:hypothetical protein